LWITFLKTSTFALQTSKSVLKNKWLFEKQSSGQKPVVYNIKSKKQRRQGHVVLHRMAASSAM
jgi:hypothetical protein